MANIFHEDFQDFLTALNKHEVEYLLIGGYAVILHGYHRTTGDMDIWVNKTEENYEKIVKAFQTFGMPVFDMTLKNFLYNPDIDVFTFGTPPVSIDLITEPQGLSFDDAYTRAEIFEFDHLQVRVIHLQDLLKLKAAANRHKDQDDIEHLK